MKRAFVLVISAILLVGVGAGVASAQYWGWPGTGPLPPSPAHLSEYNTYQVFLTEGQIIDLTVKVGKPGAYVHMFLAGPDSGRAAASFDDYVIGEASMSYRVPEGGTGTHTLEVFGWGAREMTLSWTATDRLDMDKRIERIDGPDRYATAIAASEWGWGSDEATTVVVATGSKYADALSASALAGVHDSPILLTPGTYSWTRTYPLLEELDRLGAEKVYIIGGAGAVPDELATRIATPQMGLDDPSSAGTLDWSGADVVRLGGTDRYDTAALVAEQVVTDLEPMGGFDGSVFVASGESFADALASAPYSAGTGMPLLLVRAASVPAATSNALSSIAASEAVVVGGTSVISSDAMAGLGIPAERIAGSNRYSTSLALTKHAIAEGWGDIKTYGLATGYTYPDSLPGGAAVAHAGGVLMLTPPNVLANDAALYINANKGDISSVPVFGGIGAVTGVVTGEAHFFLQ